MTYAARLAVYAPNGAKQGILAQPTSWDGSFPYNDDGSLTINVGKTSKTYELVAQTCELAVEINVTGSWTEVPGGRFLRLASSTNELDETQHVSLTCPSYGWLLRKVRLLPSVYDTTEGMRKFTNATAGVILRTLFIDAQARGAMAGVTYTFTNTHDSAGQPWAKQITIQYSPGIDYSAILLNLAAQGMVDFVWQGRELKLYNADTALSTDRTLQDPPVELRYGRDVVQAPDSSTFEDLASFVFVQGDQAAHVELNNPSAPTPWGRWENYISQGGVNDTGTLTVLAQVDLEVASREKVQITRDLVLKGAAFFPFVDYFPGNYIRAMREHTMQRFRLRQITLKRLEGGLVANVVLNDRFAEAEIRLAKRVEGIIGGANVAGGSGATPVPVNPAIDTTIPAAPTGLALATQVYVGPDGKTLGQLTVSWVAVIQNTNGTAIGDLAGYQVQIARAGSTQWEAAKLIDANSTVAYYSSLVPGVTYYARVRAYDQTNHFSTWVQTSIVIAADSTAPPVPSTPTLDSTSFYGYIRIKWDGLGSVGEQMSPDWMLTEVHASPVNNFTPDVTTKIDEFTSRLGGIAGFAASSSQPTYVKFVSVDNSGNRSDPSAQATATATMIAEIDLDALVQSKLAEGHTAQITATAAQADADAAQASANTAQTAANAANTAATTAQAAATAAQADADAALNSSQGGNNLLRSSSYLTSTYYDASKYSFGIESGNSPFIHPDGSYTDSLIWVQLTGADTSSILRMQDINAVGDWTFSVWYRRRAGVDVNFQVDINDRRNDVFTATADWQKLTYTVYNDVINSTYNFLDIQILTANGGIQLFQPMLERGNKASDYSVSVIEVAAKAKADSDAAAAAAANAQSTANTAQATATTAQTTANSAQSAAAVAQTQADTALTTANGKGRNYYQNTPPVASSTYDTWWNTGNGNQPYKWDGSNWIAQQFGDAAFANIDAGKITSGQIDTLRLNATAMNVLVAKVNTAVITDLMVANVNVGKLAAGTLSADVTVSARIKTADTGARVEMNNAGIKAYNSDGTNTFDLSSATGAVSIIGGTISTSANAGTTTPKIVMNPATNRIEFHTGQATQVAPGSIYGGLSGVGPMMQIVSPDTGQGVTWIAVVGPSPTNPNGWLWMNGALLIQQIGGGVDVTLSSVGNPIQIGGSGGLNLVMDENELQARNNGAAATYNINLNGGGINLGAASSTVDVAGTFRTNLLNAYSGSVVDFSDNQAASFRFNPNNYVHSLTIDGGTNRTQIRASSASSQTTSIKLGDTTVQARNNADTAFKAFEGLAYVNSSSITVKTNVKKHLGADLLKVVRDAPSYSWHYRDDLIETLLAPDADDIDPKTGRTSRRTVQVDHTKDQAWLTAHLHHGPMAEDLPIEFKYGRNDEGVELTDLRDMIGVLWGAVGYLGERLDRGKVPA